jgi:LysR family transcriptional regulator, hydrogen peroxide-inducible genes activator
MIQPTFRQLRHLVALAETGHFGRAAEAVHITQSTLSASIKELEAVLDVPLVDRTKRRVVLTPAGAETTERARRILAEVEDLTRSVRGSGKPLSGPLQLGVIPTIGPFLLPRILPRLRERFPELKLYLTEDLTQRLLEDLRAGRLDVLLLALPCECQGAETLPLFGDPFALAAPPDHPLARKSHITSRDLTEAPLLLLKEGHCMRGHALEACSLAKRAHVQPFEATSLFTLAQMVDNGLGVTLLPEMALEAGITQGTQIATQPLAIANAKRTIGLAFRRGTARRDEFVLLGDEIARLHRETAERK